AEERSYIRDIERLIGQPVPVASNQPFHSESIANAKGSVAPPKSNSGHGNRSSRSFGSGGNSSGNSRNRSGNSSRGSRRRG
ncbi:MAG: ATP-dependent helicase, partial [Spirochaetia bacterium]|nr:ATP-dependent helicase [Spirochaetia bacterium]